MRGDAIGSHAHDRPMRVGAGYGASQRDAFRICDYLMLGASLTAIRRIWLSFFPKRRRVSMMRRLRRVRGPTARVGEVRAAALHGAVSRHPPAASR